MLDKNSAYHSKQGGENVTFVPKIDEPFYQIRTSNHQKKTSTKNYPQRDNDLTIDGVALLDDQTITRNRSQNSDIDGERQISFHIN